MKKFITPFQNLTSLNKTLIAIFWIVLLNIYWLYYGTKDVHLFPTMSQVFKGFAQLWAEGLATHIIASLYLCSMAIIISVVLSLILSYLSTIPLVSPLSNFLSKFRYLPLTGISFYITMLVNDGRSIQIWILVVFMTTFLTTSLLSMINDIPQAEFDHARSLKCNRWQVLYEVIIKGRIDYVIETVRQNLAIVWMMLVTIESIMVASGGLGFLIKNSDKFMNHGRIVALQIIILLIGIGLDKLLYVTRKSLFRYSKF